MWKIFDVVMRIFSSVLGLMLVLSGGAFTLQGLNLAFNGPMVNGRVSSMVGDPHWILYGSIIAVLGLCQIVWSIRSPKAG